MEGGALQLSMPPIALVPLTTFSYLSLTQVLREVSTLPGYYWIDKKFWEHTLLNVLVIHKHQLTRWYLSSLYEKLTVMNVLNKSITTIFIIFLLFLRTEVTPKAKSLHILIRTRFLILFPNFALLLCPMKPNAIKNTNFLEFPI